MKTQCKLIKAALVAAITVAGIPAASAQIINESFTGASLPAGWSSSASSGTTFNFATGSGLLMSDTATPVTATNQSIVNAATSGQGRVLYFTDLGTPLSGDFAASMSFTWNNNVAGGGASAVHATPKLYLQLFDAANPLTVVAEGGIFDNSRTVSGQHYALVGGGGSSLSTSGSLSLASSGVNTLNITRTTGIISFSWLDHTSTEVFSYTGSAANNADIGRVGLSYQRLLSSSVTKVGDLNVSNVTLAIPEPSSALLIGVGVAFLALLKRHRRVS